MEKYNEIQLTENKMDFNLSKNYESSTLLRERKKKIRSPDDLSLPNQNTLIMNIIGSILQEMKKITLKCN